MSTPPVNSTTATSRLRYPLSVGDIQDGFTTRPKSNLLWKEEFLCSYGPGYCHPVSLGDTFKDGRYKVVRKLGFGDSSTVWLARDTTRDRLVALKIIMAEKSTSKKEVTALEALRANHATAKLLPTLHDHFYHDGPSGRHLCLVMEALGPSLKTVIESYLEPIDPEDLLRLARQILEATATFHEAGFAHGDIDAKYMVFSVHTLAGLSNDAFIMTLGEMKTTELLRKDGSPLDEYLPKQLVKTAEWDDWIEEDEEDIYFIDVYDSFRVGDRIPSSEAAHHGLCPPEARFEETFDYRVDLWRAGLAIYGLVFRSCPFMYFGICSLVHCMTNFVEELPSEWELRCKQIREAEALRNPHRPSHERKITPTISRIEEKFRDQVQVPELAPLLPIIQGLIRFRPQDRISARDALALLNQGNHRHASSSSSAEE